MYKPNFNYNKDFILDFSFREFLDRWISPPVYDMVILAAAFNAFKIGYSYNISMSRYKYYNSWSHQIGVSWVFFNKNE
ncbi:MAG: type IX secretion system membrane protein PorP/SprF [Flavobacteriales bacterium AspAUS03]